MNEMRKILEAESEELREALKELDARNEETDDMDELRGIGEKIKEKRERLDELQRVLAVEQPNQFDPTLYFGQPITEPSRSIGGQYVDEMGKEILSRGSRFSVQGFESRVETEGTPVGPSTYASQFIDIDPNIVKQYIAPTVVDLLSWGTISGTAISYAVEKTDENKIGVIPEGGKKTEVSYGQPDVVTETLKKVAGYIKVSDEMMNDLPYLASEIDGRLMTSVNLAVQDQILNGAGGANVTGILNRTGILTSTSPSVEENADNIYMMMSDIQNSTGLMPDGMLINPVDYQVMRLAKDGNGQYLGGGMFQNSYANTPGVVWQPPIWGLKTVVTPYIPAGTVLVGSFMQGATAYTKGGLTIESTNSNEDDFINNLVTTRGEVRLALAVRVPKAFGKITLGAE